PFSALAPDGLGSVARQSLVAGVRPEDLILEEDSDGVPAHVESAVDLGHYRRVTVSADGTTLIAFVPRSEPMPTRAPTVRATRLLLYADGHLAGVSEPVAGAVSVA